jgi:RIO-like serine/threonine protein kinase
VNHCILTHVTAHEQALRAGVLHRDISAGNIMIVDEAKSTIEFGMLIDWDLSKMVYAGGTSTARQHTRTVSNVHNAVRLHIPDMFCH